MRIRYGDFSLNLQSLIVANWIIVAWLFIKYSIALFR